MTSSSTAKKQVVILVDWHGATPHWADTLEDAWGEALTDQIFHYPNRPSHPDFREVKRLHEEGQYREAGHRYLQYANEHLGKILCWEGEIEPLPVKSSVPASF